MLGIFSMGNVRHIQYGECLHLIVCVVSCRIVQNLASSSFFYFAELGLCLPACGLKKSSKLWWARLKPKGIYI